MSLVEVMVALLVLGIGVMGYAALQLNAVKMTEDTYSRSQAMSIAQDLIERIRANVDAASAYTKDGVWTSGLTASTCFAKIPSTPAKPCAPQAMANADIYHSRRAAQTLLPNGAVAVAPCSGVTCVTVAWGQTTPSSCDQSDIDAGERGVNANCVVLEFIP